jgi:hypothetical protein
MKLDAKSEPLIRRYILAAVTEEEREQVETRLMADDDFFEQINLAEDELVDQYLDDELSLADRRRFEQSFACTADRQQKLRFARALRAYTAKNAAQHAFDGPVPRVPWWRKAADFFDLPRPVLAYSLAAALVVLAAGGPWLLFRMAGLQGRISRLEAQQRDKDAAENRWRSLVEEERNRADHLSGQLRQEQEKLTQLAANTPPSPLQPASTEFLLSPGVQRDLQPSRRLQVPKGPGEVILLLDLPQNPFQTYRAVLLNEGREILSRSRLQAEEGGGRITVTLHLPASDLPGGDYQISLYGSGEMEPMESYIFRVSPR